MLRDPYLSFREYLSPSEYNEEVYKLLKSIEEKVDKELNEKKRFEYTFKLPGVFFKYPPFVLVSEEQLKKQIPPHKRRIVAEFKTYSYEIYFSKPSLLLPKNIKHMVAMWSLPHYPGVKVVGKDKTQVKIKVKKSIFPSRKIREQVVRYVKEKNVFYAIYKNRRFPFIPIFHVEESKYEYVFSYHRNFFKGYAEGYGDLFFKTGKNYVFDYLLLLLKGDPTKKITKKVLHTFSLSISTSPFFRDRQNLLIKKFLNFLKNVG